MSKNENKTKPTDASVKDFIATIANDQRRRDCEHLLQIMTEITGEPAVMWGPSIVGFGRYHYKYATGREGDAGAAGFAPRAAALTIYFPEGLGAHSERLGKLGPHKTSKVCLYVKRLSDIDESVLREMIRQSYEYVSTHEMGYVE